jgi:hypothetical protein
VVTVPPASASPPGAGPEGHRCVIQLDLLLHRGRGAGAGDVRAAVASTDEGTVMSYLLTHFWPGGTEEQYQVTLAAATEAAGGSIPESFHAACVTDGGVVVVATYESQEVAEHFIQETLMPLMPIQGGLVGPPEERAGQNLS